MLHLQSLTSMMAVWGKHHTFHLSTIWKFDYSGHHRTDFWDILSSKKYLIFCKNVSDSHFWQKLMHDFEILVSYFTWCVNEYEDCTISSIFSILAKCFPLLIPLLREMAWKYEEILLVALCQPMRINFKSNFARKVL